MKIIYFCMVKYLSFPWLFFCLKIRFNVNCKATVWHTPWYKSKFVTTWILLSVRILKPLLHLALLQVVLNENRQSKTGPSKEMLFHFIYCPWTKGFEMSQAENEEWPAICTFQNLKKAQNKWTKHGKLHSFFNIW